MSIQAFILADRSEDRRAIHSFLAAEADFSTLGEAEVSLSGLRQAGESGADVVFVDPGAAGSLPDLRGLGTTTNALIVLVSGNRELLASAFDAGVSDFVLKPLATRRWNSAITRTRSRLAERAQPEKTRVTPLGVLKRVTIRLRDRLLVVAVADVDWFEAANNYVIVHVGTSTHVLRDTLNHLEMRLPPGEFVRVSRSAIVNLSRVREIKLAPDGDNNVLLSGGTLVPLTRGVRELQRRLECA